jgi:hypothetical protein
MNSQPGGDNGWDELLAHRPADTREAVQQRLIAAGVGPRQLRAALDDFGDELFAAATSGADDWAKPFGGTLAVALLAAEIGAFTARLTSRSSTIRAIAVDDLLDNFSAVTVAGRLGVSRQKVYDIAGARRAR